jgi:Spy/CpxP family protein refolding chaperone
MRSSRSRVVFAALIGLSVASLAGAQPPAAPRRPLPPNGAPNAGVPNAGAPNRQGPRNRAGMNGRRGAGGPDAIAGGRGGRNRGGRGNPAAMILGLRQQLELTDDQVKRLESLQGAARPKSMASEQMRARADLMDAMQGDGNLSAARTALDKMSRIRNDQTLAQLKLRQDARAILTPAQRTALENLRPRGGRGNAMGGRRQGRGGQGGRPQGFRQGGQGRGPMGPGMAPRGRRGGEPADTLTY